VRWECHGISELGDEPDENEDTILVDVEHGICLVADGMGGHAAGATASREAATTFATAIASHSDSHRLDESVLRGAAAAANGRIRELGSSSPAMYGLGTTLSAVVFNDTLAKTVHIGDSRIYHAARRGLVQLTRDHTLVQELVAAGHLSEADAEHHHLRHMLSRAIGAADDVEADIEAVSIAPGDWLLIASDGLAKAVTTDDLARAFSDAGDATPEQLCLKLLALAKRVRLVDNMSFVALRALT
jgi:protein phosphatase